MCSYLLRSYLKCWDRVNLAVDGRVVVRDLSVFPNQCNSIHIACLNCPVAWHEAFFLPEWQRLQGFFLPGERVRLMEPLTCHSCWWQWPWAGRGHWGAAGRCASCSGSGWTGCSRRTLWFHRQCPTPAHTRAVSTPNQAELLWLQGGRETSSSITNRCRFTLFLPFSPIRVERMGGISGSTQLPLHTHGFTPALHPHNSG